MPHPFNFERPRTKAFSLWRPFLHTFCSKTRSCPMVTSALLLLSICPRAFELELAGAQTYGLWLSWGPRVGARKCRSSDEGRLKGEYSAPFRSGYAKKTKIRKQTENKNDRRAEKTGEAKRPKQWNQKAKEKTERKGSQRQERKQRKEHERERKGKKDSLK